MVFRLICLLALLFSCAEKKEYNAETESRPKVVEAKGYVVPQDSMAAPRVILVDESKLKKIPAGNPKIILANLNGHIAGQGWVVMVDERKLRKIKPGNDTFTFPKVVPALGKIVSAKQSKPCSALPFRMKDPATCNIQYLDIDQGLISSYIFSILEDKNGNMWFGTQGGGVSRYDGESFTNYTEKEGLSLLVPPLALPACRHSDRPLNPGSRWISDLDEALCLKSIFYVLKPDLFDFQLFRFSFRETTEEASRKKSKN